MGSTAQSASPAPITRGPGGGVPGGSSAGADAFKRLLMSSAAGSMNLGAVRARADDLRRSIDDIIRALHLHADRVHWVDVLDKFAVVNLQYQQLSEQLRPLLKLYAVHPKAVNQENAAILPIMLATKVLPEMEVEQAALLKKHTEPNIGVPLGLQYQELSSGIESFNRFLDTLVVMDPRSPNPTGILDVKTSARTKLRNAVAAAAAQRPVTKAPVDAKRRGPPTPADSFLAAALRGDGLPLAPP